MNSNGMFFRTRNLLLILTSLIFAPLGLPPLSRRPVLYSHPYLLLRRADRIMLLYECTGRILYLIDPLQWKHDRQCLIGPIPGPWV